MLQVIQAVPVSHLLGRWIQNSRAEGSLTGLYSDFEMFICSLWSCQESYSLHGSSQQFLKLPKHFGFWQRGPKTTFYITGHFLFIIPNYFIFRAFENLSVLGDLLFISIWFSYAVWKCNAPCPLIPDHFLMSVRGKKYPRFSLFSFCLWVEG